MPLAFLDTPSGISGDIFLGCLLDAGWPLAELRGVVAALNLPADSWQIEAETVMRGPLRATLARVQVEEGDAHRHLADVRRIIEAADLPQPVGQRAVAVFTRLAQAEAHIHNTTPDEIHFHEVGALDAIVDIVGVCAGLHGLGIEQLYASPLPLGPGWTGSMHGRIPLPAPATLDLLAAVGAPTVPAPGPGELVTPTGAALLAELAEFRQPPLRVQRVGYGAGQKEFDWPNVARLWIGEGISPAKTPQESAPTAASASDSLVVIETNIDDMNPELYGPVRAALFQAGALDVWTTAIAMKKERPGTLLSVLANAADEEALADLLLRQTTTLGVRIYPVQRRVAERAQRQTQTVFGPVAVKIKRLAGEPVAAKPEFDDCLRLAKETGVPVQTVYTAAEAAAFHNWVVGASGLPARLVEKAVPVVLRQRDERLEILAFRHPKAGTQLVKGTLEPDETLAAGALRELAEESGIGTAEAVAEVGALPFLDIGQRWHFVLCRGSDDLAEPLPDEWDFFTQDDGGHRFSFFWHDLDAQPDGSWHAHFHAALAFLREQMAQRPEFITQLSQKETNE